MAPPSPELAIVPLGPGDLIDRAVRFYRSDFRTFFLIAAPPVVCATLVSVAWTYLARTIFSVSSASSVVDLSFYYLFTYFGSAVIWFTESVATLTVMGGASRNFVRHILFGEPITFRETYTNTWQRIWGLLGASIIITLILGVIGVMVIYGGAVVGFLGVFVVTSVLWFILPLAVLLSVLIAAGAVVATTWLFFLAASRFAYVPQVMLVEGQPVFPAIARSATLAGKNVTRLSALFIFSIAATYSALAVLYIPLLWYAWTQGIELVSFDTALIPAWYEIASQLIWQTSLILLTPVWMIGLCLLYVDERVRREGYDIELMAARRLGDIPSVPTTYVNPLQPALASAPPRAARERGGSGITSLDLNE